MGRSAAGGGRKRGALKTPHGIKREMLLTLAPGELAIPIEHHAPSWLHYLLGFGAGIDAKVSAAAKRLRGRCRRPGLR